MTAASHTGSLAGSYEVYQAAFLQSGIIPVRSMRETFQTAELLSSEGYPKGIRAVVIGNAGGFAVSRRIMQNSSVSKFGGFSRFILNEPDAILPADWNRRNPIDMVGDASADRFAKTFDIMIKNQDLWDIAFVIAVPSAISDPIRVANELVRFSKNTHRMIVGCMIGGDSMKTPLRILHDPGSRISLILKMRLKPSECMSVMSAGKRIVEDIVVLDKVYSLTVSSRINQPLRFST